MPDTINIPVWDQFFYYGKNDIYTETVYDLYELFLQPKRSLYYNRSASGGVPDYENSPNGTSLQVLARFDIANAVAYRNLNVVDGTNGQKDRRVAVSQNSISFESKFSNLDVSVLYFLYSDFETPRANTFPLVR